MTANQRTPSDSVSHLVKKMRSTLILLVSLSLAVTLVGTSCSAVSPSALSVGSWSLSDRDFNSQMEAFAKVYTEANGSGSDLHGPDGVSWSTGFTAAFLNDQLSLQLARLDAEQRGIEITEADREAARTALEENFTSPQGSSFFDALDPDYRTALIEGLAAQNAIVELLRTEGTSDEALRRIYDAGGDQYTGTKVCASHILIFAGDSQGQGTPTDAEYAAALSTIRSIQSQLTGTSNFADLAKRNSDDTGSGAQGGDLGCNERGAFVKEFDDAAWSQPIGTVGQPVRTVYGYHLILVTARGELTFDSVKAQIAASLRNNVRALLEVELARVAESVRIGVDGRYGRFDPSTGTIVAPAGSTSPSTIPSLASISGTGQPTSGD